MLAAWLPGTSYQFQAPPLPLIVQTGAAHTPYPSLGALWRSWLLLWEALFPMRLKSTLELLASFTAAPIPFAESLPVLPKGEV